MPSSTHDLDQKREEGVKVTKAVDPEKSLMTEPPTVPARSEKTVKKSEKVSKSGEKRESWRSSSWG